jgi:hypothetical protein
VSKREHPSTLVYSQPALGFIVDVGQQVKRLDDPSQSFQCPRQSGRSIVRLECPHQPAGLDKAQLERAGKAQQIIPMLDDQVDVDLMGGKSLFADGTCRPVLTEMLL